MSHHISSRFVGAFAKIHITQGKYSYQKLQKCSEEKGYCLCYPAPPAITGKIIHSHTPGIYSLHFFVYNCRLM